MGKIKGYKGFDKNLQCRNKQYEIGKKYHEDNAVLCESGFHFCTNPHDIFSYYSAGKNNRFCEIEANNVSDEVGRNDSKRVAKDIKINAEISVFDICKIAVKVFFKNFSFDKKIKEAKNNSSGDWGAANAGNCGAANAGDWGVAVSCENGNSSVGKEGVAVVMNGRAKGGDGAILIFRFNDGKSLSFKTAIIDGKTYKADTWYCLNDDNNIVE